MKRLFILLVSIVFFTVAADGYAELTAPAELDSVLEAKKHYSFAKEYEKNRMYQEALRQYRKSLSFRANNPNVHYDLANLLYRLNRYQEARQECFQCLQADSTFVLAHYLLAMLWHRAANYDSAIIEYEKTITLDPSYTQIHQTLASLYEYKGLFGKALEQYLRSAETVKHSSPEQSFQLYLHLGNIFARRDFFPEAISSYRCALSFNRDKDLLEKLAQLQQNNGFYRGALDSYLALSQENPANKQFLLKVADISLKLGVIAQAVSALQKLVALEPTDPEPLCHLVEIYLQQKRLGAAKRYIDEGMNLYPNNPHLCVLAGEYYKQQGEKETAVAYFKKALADLTWGKYAQRMIWEIKPPLTEEEKLKRAFFSRGKQKE